MFADLASTPESIPFKWYAFWPSQSAREVPLSFSLQWSGNLASYTQQASTVLRG
jgi:hypothetical protein